MGQGTDARRAQLKDNVDGALAQAYAEAGGSHGRLAAAEGFPVQTVSRWLLKHGIRGGAQPAAPKSSTAKPARPGYQVDHVAGTATVVSQATRGPFAPEDVIRGIGLDPADWDIIGCKANAWEALAQGGDADRDPVVVTLHQTTLQLKRKVDLVPFIRPARADGWRPVKRAQRPEGKPTTGIIVGDQQFPMHDPQLHQAIAAWIDDVNPDWGILTGDTVNASDISRHPENPGVDDVLLEGIDAAYLGLRDYVTASPNTAWRKLRGNHDARVDDHVLQNARKLWGLRRAALPDGTTDGTVFDLSFLLRLDELGIDLHQPPGRWSHAQLVATPGVVVRHAAAKSAMERLTHSLIVGDSHRQSLRDVVRYDEERRPVQQLFKAETGCTCLLNGEGLGYTVEPDWQQGFAVVTAWPDGTHHVDLARYRGGMLTWRDRAYRGT